MLGIFACSKDAREYKVVRVVDSQSDTGWKGKWGGVAYEMEWVLDFV